jgi:hypothetical protein
MHSSGTYIVLAVSLPSKVDQNFMSHICQFFIKHIIHSISNYQSSPEAQKLLVFCTFNPFQPSDAMWLLAFHLSLICMSFA